MERDPGEYIVDPWVIERETWVAIEDDRLVAAVHLHRYGDRRTRRFRVAERRGDQLGRLLAGRTSTPVTT